MMNDPNRLKYLQIIESEKLLNNRFKSIKRIDPAGGNGYFSLMFTSVDIQNDEKVALKFFDPSKLSDSERRKRFEREAEMLMALEKEPMVIRCINGGLQFLPKTLVDSNTGLEIAIDFPFIALELAECSVEDLIYSSQMHLHFYIRLKRW